MAAWLRFETLIFCLRRKCAGLVTTLSSANKREKDLIVLFIQLGIVLIDTQVMMIKNNISTLHDSQRFDSFLVSIFVLLWSGEACFNNPLECRFSSHGVIQGWYCVCVDMIHPPGWLRGEVGG
jgi:hypothetical protein